jgi:hypothetical protein
VMKISMFLYSYPPMVIQPIEEVSEDFIESKP